MLIRIKGHVAGVKEYLETGQKQGRELGRDELDERVILAGDLDLANHIIEAMESDGERYLTITLPFREDEVDERMLRDITADFERFMFAAYRPEEYCFYAEAHLPRVKAYEHRKSGERVVRKPHIHIVVPKENLLSGRKLDPFAMVKYQERYIDAFQEHINQRYGLASPKDHRRADLTDASEMIARYKGDTFTGGNRELKAAILEAVLERGIERHEDFRALLDEFGERRTRNEGRESEYENVKPEGAAKGVNLKEYVFSRDFIELDAHGKEAMLGSRFEDAYSEAGAVRPTPEDLSVTLAEWYEVRSKEVKYFNGGNLKAYPFYQQADTQTRQALLAEREERFYQRFSEDHIHEHIEREQRGYTERIGADWHPGYRGAGEPEIAPAAGGKDGRGVARSAGIAVDREPDAGPDRASQAPESADHLRSVPGFNVDGIEQGGTTLLLPDHASLHLGDVGAALPEALRWPGARPGAGGQGTGVARTRLSGLDTQVEGMYQAFAFAGPDERATMIAGGARKFDIEEFGLKGGIAFSDPYAPEPEGWSLADIGSLRDVPGFLEGAGAGRRIASQEVTAASLGGLEEAEMRMWAFGEGMEAGARHPVHRRAEDRLATARSASRVRPERERGRFNDRARESTGREKDSALHQHARDHVERQYRSHSAVLGEFQQIRQSLDAGRLLAALAHSHGLIASKYAVTKGRDGSDRIQCGARNLNVSDFLTKEMHLPWVEAARILRDTYARQLGREPSHAHARAPHLSLWKEFQGHRDAEITRERDAWATQRASEKERRQASVGDYKVARSRIEGDEALSRADRRAALSLARMEKVERDSSLRAAIEGERAVLRRTSRPPFGEHYREFLQERAQGGDTAALRELRRLRPIDPPAHDGLSLRPPREREDNAIVYAGGLTHDVDRYGVVTYKLSGVNVMSDEGNSVRVWTTQDAAIENALRLAAQKFGREIRLEGPAHFQVQAARIAADLRMNVRFDEPALNDIMDARREQVDAQDAEQRQAQRQYDAAMRALARQIRDGRGEGSALDSDPNRGNRTDPEQDPGLER
ncbi:LPD7 domain-containing protein [Paraburkholderia sp. BR10882]|uniref:LPD7 domain-containing protein n=2 Tax=unclassified Paraburkholderia TaxID=2615204 RepID=UPI0034CF8CB0